jgi:hypothetical protein
MLTRQSVPVSHRAAVRRCASRPVTARPRRCVVTRAFDDTNLFVNLLTSVGCGAITLAVTTITAEDTDKEIERLQTIEGAGPVLAAVAADAVAHSIPGLSIVLGLASEPAGAAAGVAYMMSLILSSPAVDPTTLAPKGTIVNAEKAEDSRGSVRVPFTQIVPTLLKVVDFENTGSSGAGWTKGKDGLPKLPINSVLIVLGVGGLILEAASHGPLLSLFMPRVLSVACWLAAVGYILDKRETSAA